MRYNDFRSFVNYFHVLDVNWGVRVCSNHRFIQLGTIWRMKVRGIWTYEKLYLAWFLMVTFVEVAVCFRVLLMTLCRILLWSTRMFYTKMSINWKKDSLFSKTLSIIITRYRKILKQYFYFIKCFWFLTCCVKNPHWIKVVKRVL